MKIYFAQDCKQFGPIEINELNPSILTPDTQVWYQGLSSWRKASSVEILNEYFEIQKSLQPIEPVHHKTKFSFSKFLRF